MTKLSNEALAEMVAAYDDERDRWISRDARWVPEIKAYQVCRFDDSGLAGEFSETHEFRTAVAAADGLIIIRDERAMQAAWDASPAGELVEAVKALSRCLLPVHMTLAQEEMIGEPVPDASPVLAFSGSGASDFVTAGEIRLALEKGSAALSNLGAPHV